MKFHVDEIIILLARGRQLNAQAVISGLGLQSINQEKSNYSFTTTRYARNILGFLNRTRQQCFSPHPTTHLAGFRQKLRFHLPVFMHILEHQESKKADRNTKIQGEGRGCSNLQKECFYSCLRWFFNYTMKSKCPNQELASFPFPRNINMASSSNNNRHMLGNEWIKIFLGLNHENIINKSPTLTLIPTCKVVRCQDDYLFCLRFVTSASTF